MTGLLIFLLVILVGSVALVLFAVGIYNGLVRVKNQVDNAWSQIDVQLKRRYDLIPNLVETVKGYASHEKETLERVIQARNAAMGAGGGGLAERGAAEGALSGALKSVFALSESYPDLKANTNFLALQEELTSTENKIAFARQFYNDATMGYNTRIESVPDSIFAGIFRFEKKPYFEIEEKAQREAPKVSF